MKEIETREDLERLLAEFYRAATTDREIKHHFADLDLKTHLPIIADFWEKVLFGKPVYFGNPLFVHQFLHGKSLLKPAHFRRWLEIFSRTVDELFVGKIAEDAKLRARMIARALNQKLNPETNPQISRN